MALNAKADIKAKPELHVAPFPFDQQAAEYLIFALTLWINLFGSWDKMQAALGCFLLTVRLPWL